MSVLWLRLRAPFAAFRPMRSRYFPWVRCRRYRLTAAHGLVLDLGAIESREEGTIDYDASTRRCAAASDRHWSAGRRRFVDALYQQLHGYPVGNSGKELAPRAKGAKFWIVPVRREVLAEFDVVLGAQGDAAVLERATRGLRGEFNQDRYGLPFAGDNSFLFDRIEDRRSRASGAVVDAARAAG